VFENRVLRRIFRPKRDERREAGENCIMRSFINRQVYDQIKKDEMHRPVA
jgi:hypothetical protein